MFINHYNLIYFISFHILQIMQNMLYKWPIEISLQAPVTQEGNFDHNELFI